MKNSARLKRGPGLLSAGGRSRWTINRIWLILMLCGVTPKMLLKVQAEEARPRYKSLVFLSNHPKSGHSPTSEPGNWRSGQVRNAFETYYEGWWREYSYHRADPATGIPERGWYMDTKTYNYVNLPWAMQPAGGVSTNVIEVVGTGYPLVTEYSGGTTLGQISPGTFQLNIGGTQFNDYEQDGNLLSGNGSGTIAYGSGNWTVSLSNAPEAEVNIVANYFIMTQPAMNDPKNWVNLTPDDEHILPDFRGEFNFEVNLLGDPVELYIPETWSDGSDREPEPLLDMYWTPGFRFQDTAQPPDSRNVNSTRPDGRFTEEILPEDRWLAEEFNLPGYGVTVHPRLTGGQQWNPAIGGEFYVDYDYGTDLASGVIDCDGEIPVTLYWGMNYPQFNIRTNITVSVTEFDLNPIDGVAEDMGDLVHTVREGGEFDGYNDSAGSDPGEPDISTNQRFDYMVIDGQPLVRQTGAMSWGQWQAPNGVPMGSPAAINAGYTNWSEAVWVVMEPFPVYQAGQLWGVFGYETYGPAINIPGVLELPASTNRAFINSIRGPEWSDGKRREEFEPFISWWIWDGGEDGLGTWLAGVSGSPIGNLPDEDPDPYTWIDWITYTNYIHNNYPGDAYALAARSLTREYHGPDGWVPSGVYNKYQVFGLLEGAEDPVTIQPGLGYGSSGWDPYNDYPVAPDQKFQAWWESDENDPAINSIFMRGFGAYSSDPAPDWIAALPDAQPWVQPEAPSRDPQGTFDSQKIWDDALFPRVQLNTFNERAYPLENTSWGYNAPREFADLPSSMYHTATGGDMRLGEVTAPTSYDIFGQDRGANGVGPNLQEDYVLPSAGPLAFNIHGIQGLDGGNLLNLEFMTWRIDGQSFTGPRGVHPASGDTPPIPPPGHADHRDVNLDGLIDLGETIPENSFNYLSCHNILFMPDGMLATGQEPLFSWLRYMEDMIEAWDEIEDFHSERWHASYKSTGGEAERVLVAPAGSGLLPMGLTNNTPHTAWLNVDGSTNLTDEVGFWELPGFENSRYDSGLDVLWIDANTNNIYEDELILNPLGEANLTNGTAGAALATVRYFAMTPTNSRSAGTNFVPDVDFAWYDADNDSIFDTDLVLRDGSGTLAPGMNGEAVTEFYATYTCLWENVSGGSFTDRDNYWIEWISVNSYWTNSMFVVETNLNRRVLYAGSSTINWTNGTDVTDYVFYRHPQNQPPFDSGADVWIKPAPGPYGTVESYDAEEPVHMPNGRNLQFSAAFYTNELDRVAYIDADSSGNYEYMDDYVWRDNAGAAADNQVYESETIIITGDDIPAQFVNGAQGVGAPWPVSWLDLPGVDLNTGTNTAPDGAFTQRYGYMNVQGIAYYGDAIWLDFNTNGIYDINADAPFTVPIYGVGLYNTAGVSPPGAFLSGNGFSVPTRDGRDGVPFIIGGFNQVEPALAFGLLTHEQAHDVLGWPDLYDYTLLDFDGGDIIHWPLGVTDLMIPGGGLWHGLADLKPVTHVNLRDVLGGAAGLGPQTVLLYPIERYEDQYYYFDREDYPQEWEVFRFWFQADDSPYSGPLGRGVHISNTQAGNQWGYPRQQRSSHRFTWRMIQADGLYEMEDGISNGDNADLFPGSTGNRMFTPLTIPAARWWDQTPAGIRILDIKLPEERGLTGEAATWGPAEVTFEWFNVYSPVHWDPPGTGVGVDSDGDGIPDAWEYFWFHDYPDPLAIADQYSDYDGDGLPDYAEYLAGLDPTYRFSWSGGTDTTLNDADVDLDGDGLSNFEEYFFYGTDMLNPDTDDDGFSDGDEVNGAVICGGRAVSSPVYSRSPLIERSARFHSGVGGGRKYIPSWQVPLSEPNRFQLPEWTLEAWVRLDTATETGTILLRETQQGRINFEMGVNNSTPYVRFTTDGGLECRVESDTPLIPDTWVHLTGVWAQDRTTLELWINGQLDAANNFIASASIGHVSGLEGDLRTGTTYLGGSFNGYIDEVRIWGRARTEAEIVASWDKTINTPWVDLTQAVEVNYTIGGSTNDATGEQIATANPGALTYSGMLENQNLVPGSLGIVAGPHIFFDNGDGTMTGSASNTYGNVQYLGGSWFIDLVAIENALPADALITASYQYIIGQSVGTSNVVIELTRSTGNDGTLIANFRFDDGTNTNIVNALTGEVEYYGAEDYVHLNDWRYSLGNSKYDYVGVTNFSSEIHARIWGTTGRHQRPYDDLNEDGIPDWWQQLFWQNFDPFSINDVNEWDPDQDPDGDGVSNYHEYLAGTNPKLSDSDGNQISDYNEDTDLDGLVNGIEFELGTSIWLSDTDDDGINDYEEYVDGSNPASALAPQRQQVLALPGAANAYVEFPEHPRFGQVNWTIEAWVRPDAAGGTVIRRQIEDVPPVYNNYVLGLTDDGVPYAGFGTNILTAPAAIPTDGSTWTHLAASYTSAGRILRLYTNGMQVAETQTANNPRVRGVGPVEQRIGESYEGWIDEVRIWSTARDTNEIQNSMSRVLTGVEDDLVSYYRFDDGTSATNYIAPRWYGTSGNTNWWWGQVEDFVETYREDWLRDWLNAGTLHGPVAITNITAVPAEHPFPMVPDTDGDGLPDWWELEFLEKCVPGAWLDPLGTSGPDGDPDGDGLTNLEEFILGTDPCVPNFLSGYWYDSDFMLRTAIDTMHVQVGDSVLLMLERPAEQADMDLELEFVVSDTTLFNVGITNFVMPFGTTEMSVPIVGVALAEGLGRNNGRLRVLSPMGGLELNVQVHNGIALDMFMAAATETNVVAGDTVTVTIDRQRSVGYQATPIPIYLTSSDTNLLTVPEMVMISGGSDRGWFPAYGQAASPTNVIIKAQSPGYPPVDMKLRVLPPNLTFWLDGELVTNDIPVHVEGLTRLQVQRAADQVGTALSIHLHSSDHTLFDFNQDTLDPSGSNTYVDLNLIMGPNVAAMWFDLRGIAIAQGADNYQGYVRVSNGAWLTNLPVQVYDGQELDVATEGAANVKAGDTRSFTVTRVPAAGVIGGLDKELTVTLTSLNADALLVPQTVVIPAYQESVSFAVRGLSPASDVAFVATAAGYPSKLVTLDVLNPDLTIEPVPLEVVMGNERTFFVRRPITESGAPLTVTFASSAPTVMSPGTLEDYAAGGGTNSVTFPAGVDVATYTLTGLSEGTANLLATVGTYTFSELVTVDAVPLVLSTPTLTVGHRVFFTITRNPNLILDDLEVTIENLTPAAYSVTNETVILASNAFVTVGADGLAYNTNAQIRVSAPGYETVTASFRVEHPTLWFDAAAYNVETEQRLPFTLYRDPVRSGAEMLVSLASSEANVFTVRPLLLFQAGQTSVDWYFEGGADTNWIGSNAVLTASVGAYSTNAVVTLVAPTVGIRDIWWHDEDFSEDYSQGDRIEFTFATPMSNETVVVSNLLLYAGSGASWTLQADADWGAGATLQVQDPGTNRHYILTLGSNPNLQPGWGLDPTTNVLDLTGAPDATDPPVPLPATPFGYDSDGDGMPDWWEIENNLNPFDATGLDGADGDPDGDGLSNLYEYLASTGRHATETYSPWAADSSGNGLIDYHEDSDGDGLTNGEEQDLYGTHPGDRDTDDDGFEDGEEVNATVLSHDRRFTSPVYSRSPMINRSLVLDGNAIDVKDPVAWGQSARFDLASWTLEAWIMPTNSNTGAIMARVTDWGQTNFMLRLDANVPSVRFTTMGRTEYFAGGSVAIPTGEWTHLAGVWDDDNNSLALYVNGIAYRAQGSLEPCARGRGTVTIGDGLLGYLDELRVWSGARSAADIAESYNRIINTPLSYGRLVANYRFDDGGETIEDFAQPLDWRYALEGTVTTNEYVELVGRDDYDRNGIEDWWQDLMFGENPLAALTEDSVQVDTNGMLVGFSAIVTNGIPEQDWRAAAAPIGRAQGVLSGSDDIYLLRDFYVGYPMAQIDPMWGRPTRIEFDGVIDFDYNNAEMDYYIMNAVGVDYSDVGANTVTGPGRSRQFFRAQGLVADITGRQRLAIRFASLRPDNHFDAQVAITRMRIVFSLIGVVEFDMNQVVVPFGGNWMLFGMNGASELPPVDTSGRSWNESNYGMSAEDLDAAMAYDPAGGMRFSTAGEAVPLPRGHFAADPDGDGLNNLYEFYCDTNPLDQDTDNNGVLDGDEDYGNTGLKNIDEQTHGTAPWLTDTDDDGIPDLLEKVQGSDPASSRSPQRFTALHLDGASHVEFPAQPRFGLRDFTLEAWINPDAGEGTNAVLISRAVEAGVTNFFLRLDDSMNPQAGFGTNVVTATNVVVNSGDLTNGWTYLAATYSVDGQWLRIYAGDGSNDVTEVASKICSYNPRISGVGPVEGRIGVGLQGLIEDVRIWNVARTQDELQANFKRTLLGLEDGLVAYYRFDDGTSGTNAANSGVSGVAEWSRGHTEDYVLEYREDWWLNWMHAATLVGTAEFVELDAFTSPIRLEIDSDGDGLPDWWEIQYGLDPFDATGDQGAWGDPDGDGIPNIEEYRLGLNPMVPDILFASPDPVDVQVGDFALINVTRPPVYTNETLDLTLYTSDASLFAVGSNLVDLAEGGLETAPVITMPLGATNIVFSIVGVGLGEGLGSGNGILTISSLLGALTVDVNVLAGQDLTLTMPGATSTNVVVGDTVTMRVQRQRSAAGSPFTPLTVSLSSTDPSVLSVPATVIIPQGMDEAWFTVTGAGGGAATVVAQAHGYPVAQQSVSVTEPTLTYYVDSVAVATIPTHVGGITRVTVVRESTEAGAALTLNLSSSDGSLFTVGTVGTNELAETGGTNTIVELTLGPGVIAGMFTVEGVYTAQGLSASNGVLYVRSGAWMDTVPVQVYAGGSLDMTMSGSTNVVAGDTRTVTIRRNPSAGISGALEKPLTVLLTSLNAAALAVPESVVIEAYQDTASFTVTGVLPSDEAVILAQASGYPSGLLDVEVGNPSLTMSVSPNPFTMGEQAVVTLTRESTQVGGDLTVTLQSADPTVFTVNVPTVTIAAGFDSAVFTISGLAAGTVDLLGTVGAYSATESVEVLPVAMQISQGFTITAGDQRSMVLTRNENLTENELVVTLVNLSPLNITIPASATIPAGDVFVTFPVQGLLQTTNAQIRAEAPGYNDGLAVVTVTDPTLTFDSANYEVEVDGSTPFTVTRDPNEAGAELRINLSSGTTNVFSVRPTLLFQAGEYEAGWFIHGGSDTNWIGSNTIFVASYGPYAVTSIVELTDITVGIRGMTWYDWDFDMDYSQDDELIVEFSLPMSNATVMLANLPLYVQSGTTWVLNASADWGAGATIQVQDPGTNRFYLITLGANPNLTAGWGVDPTTNVLSAAGDPDATEPPFPLPSAPHGYDSDGDGMPDWWEIENDLDPFSAEGDDGAWGDPDGDGLVNLYEYLASTGPDATGTYSPWSADSSGNGISDYDEDSDGDGISNGDEQDLFGTHPGDKDTDDDGFEDGEEVNSTIYCGDRRLTSPVYGRSPLIQRSMVLDGVGISPRDPAKAGDGSRFDLAEWTLEAWVMPTNSNTGALILRTVPYGETGDLRTNFTLRLDANVPSVRFTTMGGTEYAAGGNVPVPENVWTHLAGVWDPDNDALSLYVNGLSYQSLAVVERCATAARGNVTIGDSLLGYLDELRVWNIARTAEDIADNFLGFATFVSRVTSDQRVYEGVVFAEGDKSFATSVTLENLDAGTATEPNLYMNTTNILGPPDGEFVSLGVAATTNGPWNTGWIIVELEDITLRASGDSRPELVIYERGSMPESVHVFVSEDGDSWGYVGLTEGGVSMLDLDSALFETMHYAPLNPLPWSYESGKPGELYENYMEREFRYVWLIDGGTMITSSGAGETSTLGMKGADIDAVGVLTYVRDRPIAWYPFDDGGRTAEDFANPLDWAYALSGVTFSTNVYAPVYGILDSDGDGLPDWWEDLFFGGPAAADADPDGDGLNNFYEYLADTNPKAADTDNNGILDGDEDPDRDGLSNRAEQLAGTHPRLPDTDDDGALDGAEAAWASQYDTDPANSLKKLTPRLAQFGGGVDDVIEMPLDLRFALTDWTVEAKVRSNMNWADGQGVIRHLIGPGVTNTTYGAVLVERRVGRRQLLDSNGDPYAMNLSDNFVLGITSNGYALAGFNDTWVQSSVAIPNDGNALQMISATFDSETGMLRIFVNGIERGSQSSSHLPHLSGVGPIVQRIGSGFAGEMYDVRIWNAARDGSSIQWAMDATLMGTEQNLVAYYRFDDSTRAQLDPVSGRWYGTSGNPDWTWGQIEDFTQPNDWWNDWRNGASLRGNIQFVKTFPHVVGVTSTNANGTYYPGDTIDVTVIFSEYVQVTAPVIELDTGEVNQFAFYSAGNNTNLIQFAYIVQPQDWNIRLDYAGPDALWHNGVPITTSADGTVVDLTLPLPGAVGSLSWYKDIFVDPPRPNSYLHGMSTQWLYDHFGEGYSKIDPNMDYDGDGMTVYEEYLAGTDPNDPTSSLAMEPMGLVPEGVTVNWKAVAGKSYDVQYTDNLLLPWKTWKTVTADRTDMSVQDDGSETGGLKGTRYYRVIVK